MSHGGERVAEVLVRHGVETLFTLCGGHISPILVGAKKAGLRVVDTRHEASAVFAADATARLTGRPGVAAVTAGPGVTNTITALENAQMAESPVLVLGGATATVLKGRGSLQDIDQQALVAPHVKWQASARRVAELAPLVETALARACGGVPGPVFVECPVDLLYPEGTVREWYGVAPREGERPPGLGKRLERLYLGRHLAALFRGADRPGGALPEARADGPSPRAVRRATRALARAGRPVLVVGSQAMLHAVAPEILAVAIERLGVPVYLSGMARGLLGAEHPLLLRHHRREALRDADWVLLAGVPCDFRLDYGRAIRRGATLVGANRSREALARNRRPDIEAPGDPALFLSALAERSSGLHVAWADWLETLQRRDAERGAAIVAQAAARPATGVHPIALLDRLDAFLDDRALLIADGGDFVGTAAYIVRPRRPLAWLDPGAFGTLGVGGGFALGAKVARPEAEVWVLYGDGSLGYSLAEFDSFARQGLPVIALVGNDASWAQIARDQVPALGDAVGTELAPLDYHLAAEGLGGRGIRIDREEEIAPAFARARAWAAEGKPVLINARLAPSDFRKGSISL